MTSQRRCRPLLFVDIDGVISLFGFPLTDVPEGTWTQVDGFAHLLSAVATEHLHTLGQRFEVVWCSGWEDRANDHLPHLLQVPAYPYVTFGTRPADGCHWKLAAVRERAGTRPAAWIDDDLDDSVRAWAAQRDDPTLLVETDPAVGLDDVAAARLLAWADAVAGAPPVAPPTEGR